MPAPGQGWLTGAKSTSPERTSAWSSARFKASAPAQEWPTTMARSMPISRSAARMMRACVADAVAPAAARPVDGDDPEAPRQPLAERRHGIARGAGGAVQEKHRRVGLAPLRRHLDDVQAPARDL